MRVIIHAAGDGRPAGNICSQRLQRGWGGTLGVIFPINHVFYLPIHTSAWSNPTNMTSGVFLGTEGGISSRRGSLWLLLCPRYPFLWLCESRKELLGFSHPKFWPFISDAALSGPFAVTPRTHHTTLKLCRARENGVLSLKGDTVEVSSGCNIFLSCSVLQGLKPQAQVPSAASPPGGPGRRTPAANPPVDVQEFLPPHC